MFFKYLKLLCVSLGLLAVLFPSVSFAADPRCWDKDACVANTGVFYGPTSETIKACGTDKDASGKVIGFCLPVGEATTAVSFGQKNVFTNFGEFIKWIYQYGIQVAGGLAVVMIIVAGFEWITSGGSPEKIGSAKKRIGGAMMGLFLAVMSYFILNMVNPYLVNFRLPKIWKVNTLGLVPPYCDDVQGGKKVGLEKGVYDKSTSEAECGKDYFVEGTGDGGTCKGMYCKGRDACVPFSVAGNKKAAGKCSKEYLSIHYVADPSAQTSFKEKDGFLSYLGAVAEAHLKLRVNEPEWLDEDGLDAGDYNTALAIMCDDSGSSYIDVFNGLDKGLVTRSEVKVDQNNNPLAYWEYLLEISSASLQSGISGSYKCKQGGKAVGFYIKNEVDLEADAGDVKMYLSSLQSDAKRLVASRWGGVEGGMWYIPFDIFKDKNHFFELNLTVDMLKNMASERLSKPKLGKEGKASSAFSFSGDDITAFWASQVAKLFK